MSDPILALKTALYVALDSALSEPVFDHVPQGTDYPYVTFGQFDANNSDYLSERKESVSAFLSVWSDYSGQTEVMRIMGDINTALHGKKLTMGSGRLVRVLVESRETNPEPDGETYMGRVRLSALIEHD